MTISSVNQRLITRRLHDPGLLRDNRCACCMVRVLAADGRGMVLDDGAERSEQEKARDLMMEQSSHLIEDAYIIGTGEPCRVSVESLREAFTALRVPLGLEISEDKREIRLVRYAPQPDCIGQEYD